MSQSPPACLLNRHRDVQCEYGMQVILDELLEERADA